MTKHPLDLQSLKIGAILNTSSGSCDLDSEDTMLEILRVHGIPNPKIWCGGADEVDAAFKEATEHKLDVLIVLGGDGTIRTAAEMCTPEGPLLIALPGGTMNMLPKALYGEGTWEEVLTRTLQSPTTKVVSGGKIAEQKFFIAAIIGAPALWAEARESIRGGDISGAIEKGAIAFQNMFTSKVGYSFSKEEHGEAEAISVICPLISEAIDDSEKVLEVAVIDVQDAGSALSLASSAAFGKWRDDNNIHIVTTKAVTVHSDKDIPAIIDGETITIGKEGVVEFIPQAFTAIVPA